MDRSHTAILEDGSRDEVVSTWRTASGAMTSGERWAQRMLRMSRRSWTPWWMAAGGTSVCASAVALNAWLAGDRTMVVAMVILIAVTAANQWERQGFTDLLDRYDRELHHAREAR